jgi:hypothetical protein
MKQSKIALVFKTASGAAIRRAFNCGVSVTARKGKMIVRRSASGAEKQVLSLDRAYTKPVRVRYSLQHA